MKLRYISHHHCQGIGAATGYLVDLKMYKFPDFRCLKAKAGVGSSEWPHYEMAGHRAARTERELEKVEEIPFNKEYNQPHFLVNLLPGIIYRH